MAELCTHLDQIRVMATEETTCLERLRADDAVVEQVYQVVQDFMQMLRGRQGERLDAWIEQAQDSGIDELRRFAAGLLPDHAAFDLLRQRVLRAA
jgi:transposase